MIIIVAILAPLVLVGVAVYLQFRWTRGPFLLRKLGVKATAEAIEVEHLRGAVMSGSGEYNMQPTRQQARLQLRVTRPGEQPYEASVTTFMPTMAPTDRLTVYASKRNREKVYIAWDESTPKDITGGEYGRQGPATG